MKHNITQEALYQILAKEFRSKKLTEDDWASFLTAVNAPSKLAGIYEVAIRLASLSDLLKPPIICDNDLKWIKRIDSIARIIKENHFLLRKKLGDEPIKKPSGTAQTHPLYYLLFHQHKPGMAQEFSFVLTWLFIAFHKFSIADQDGKKPSGDTIYKACLGLRGISDELATGNALETMNLKLVSLHDVADELRKISAKKEIVRHGAKTREYISSIVSLLRPRPKKSTPKVHSTHQRSYFLPTPHRGYIPLISRNINRSSFNSEPHFWSPSEMMISDILDSQLRNYGSEDDSPCETNSRLSTIEIRQESISNPELYHYQLLSISNAIARKNQSIPFKSNAPIFTDVEIYLAQIWHQNINDDISAILTLNLYTGIPLEQLSGITFIDETNVKKHSIYLDVDNLTLILPIITPERRRHNRDNPTHYPLALPKLAPCLSKYFNAIRDNPFQNQEGAASQAGNKIFRHRTAYYLRAQKKLIKSINDSKGTNLSAGKLGQFLIDRGYYYGIDPTILTQISQTVLSNSRTQAHYTAVSANNIQKAYQIIWADISSMSSIKCL